MSIGAQTAGTLGGRRAAAGQDAGAGGLAWGPLLAVIALRTILLVAFDGRYGYQRDELYYALAGHHLQAGYVEFPPVTALLARASDELWGSWLTGLRILPALAGAATMLLAALIARELGGSRRAQWMAGALVGFTPLMLSTNGLFQPVSFDQTATMLVLWLALRICLGKGGWVWLGLAAGVGLETKYTLAFVLVALLAGALAWRRNLLRSPGAAGAAAIAAVIVLPNLIWQAGHHWVSGEFFANPPPSATDETRPGFVIDLIINANPLAVPVAVAGWLGLWRRRPLRPLAAAVAVTLLLYLVLGGKSYYAEPVVLFALAAGAPALDRFAARRRLLPWALAWGAVLLAGLPVLVPVLPLRKAIDAGVVRDRSDYQDELGWPGLAATVARRSGGAQVVIAANYGEAGALALYGRDLPPVASPDVSLRFWRPAVAGRTALLVGFDAAEAARFCSGFSVLARITMPVANQERGQPVARCVLRAGLAGIWPQIVALSPL